VVLVAAPVGALVVEEAPVAVPVVALVAVPAVAPVAEGAVVGEEVAVVEALVGEEVAVALDYYTEQE
jgi:hypothetical protein